MDCRMPPEGKHALIRPAAIAPKVFLAFYWRRHFSRDHEG